MSKMGENLRMSLVDGPLNQNSGFGCTLRHYQEFLGIPNQLILSVSLKRVGSLLLARRGVLGDFHGDREGSKHNISIRTVSS